ncbi:hypothetical protein B0H13DRAFT_1863219 [Mycena leptocephala]|nr:hypothetical protein B0H13DRAFT_1863219 [Mycena leptocephala]
MAVSQASIITWSLHYAHFNLAIAGRNEYYIRYRIVVAPARRWGTSERGHHQCTEVTELGTSEGEDGTIVVLGQHAYNDLIIIKCAAREMGKTRKGGQRRKKCEELAQVIMHIRPQTKLSVDAEYVGDVGPEEGRAAGSSISRSLSAIGLILTMRAKSPGGRGQTSPPTTNVRYKIGSSLTLVTLVMSAGEVESKLQCVGGAYFDTLCHQKRAWSSESRWLRAQIFPSPAPQEDEGSVQVDSTWWQKKKKKRADVAVHHDQHVPQSPGATQHSAKLSPPGHFTRLYKRGAVFPGSGDDQARTTLHQIFLHELRGIWKQAFINLGGGLPACPPDLNEIQYANLVFPEHYHAPFFVLTNTQKYCVRNLYLQADWDLRVRCCSECELLHMTVYDSDHPSRLPCDPSVEIRKLIVIRPPRPFLPIKSVTLRPARLNADLLAITAAYDALDPQDRTAYVASHNRMLISD